MPELWLIRHGETEWTVSGQHTGRTDVPLTPRGRLEAQKLGRRLKGKRFALVLTSPLSRAQETCRLTGYLDGASLEENLMEWDYGAFEGKTSAQIQKEIPGWTIWSGLVPGGETLEQVGARADRVLARIRGVDGEVALFSHGHALRVLAARWMQMPPEGGRYFALGTASLSQLGHEHGFPVIQSWNERYDLLEVP